MRICPRCRERFPTGERFCTRDAAVLVETLDMERIGTTVGNYHLDQILGRGGMGTVYSGEHVYIRKKVAVKVLHRQFARFEEAVQRFLREARAASSINHPNIVDVTDFGPMPDGSVFFVMEYLDGTSLEDVIEREGALPLHRGINIANQMALALGAAHDQHIVHRDLKPDNVMLIRRPGRRDLIRAMQPEPAPDDAPTGQFVIEREEVYDFVKLLDFGIAKVLADGQEEGGTLRGAVFGTPEYMSPEAARGDDVDHRSDLYSLGVIFFDMITGHPPFEADLAADVLAMHLHEPAPVASRVAPEREITPAADRLILRAMAKDPAHRHQSADEFREQLQHCFGSVAYKRNAASIPGAPSAGPEHRARRLTEELDEWLNSGGGGMSLQEARNLALARHAEARVDEVSLARALDAALEDDD
jgi:eukaryotic-like serine/threonine-protein kinase